jgi:hypothetical protein
MPVPTYVVACRVGDPWHVHVRGQTRRECSRCHAALLVSPDGRGMAEAGGLPYLCLNCLAELRGGRELLIGLGPLPEVWPGDN